MKHSSIAFKYPTYRDDSPKSCKRWLDGKRIDDNAEGLWRVHDKLYDLRLFMKNHPGGKDWLEMTKGVDITELFEIHHITDSAEKILPKFYVRDASSPRNYKITFEENGFYKTMKRRLASKLESLDESQVSNSRFYCDFMLTSTILFSVIAARDNNYLIASLAALSLSWLVIITHNFIHQKDNWRMYLMNLSLLNYRDWRVFHVMSHHHYPNSYHDLEISFFEPFLNWMPEKKTKTQIYFYWAVSPIVYASTLFSGFIMRMSSAIFHNQQLFADDLMPLLLPTTMYIFGNINIYVVVKIWLFIVMLSSFFYMLVAINAGHHHREIFHEGDELKSLDFGVYQLAATIDKVEVKNSLFLTLTTFGQHILHHFFPSLDHSLLPQLTEMFYETCQEFENEFREFPWWELIKGQYIQLARTETTKLSN
ncbi:CLUMA_CG002379, isoform A [Clunio marinus]|uniref:Cytochrome b5-related protein n=1 Tax=Clunio marinus TaxID=568069 RepID=A0A1J1HMT1_9DIPT|nr:CLUMA_CG002379, isoform A [Clunio marinus]